MQKVLVFGQMTEFLSTVIKSCRANFGVKWRVFFSTSIFVPKCQFWKKKIEFREKCWFFQTSVHYYWKWISYWKTCSFSENCDFLCECLYTLRNCQNMIKTSIFLRKWVFVHMLIFIRVFLLLENCYLDSFLSTVIKSSRAKLWGKVTSVFLNINICAKLNFLGKKIEILWEILTFSNNCALLVSVNILLENMLIFRKFWLCVNVYIH